MGDAVFGPIRHGAHHRADGLDAVRDAINAAGYGLTPGVPTRIDARARDIPRRARVGNCYVTRNMVRSGAGLQPVGGEGLSGIGA